MQIDPDHFRRFPVASTKLGEATMFALSASWRKCCDAYKSAFLACRVGDDVSSLRFYSLSGCCSTLNDRTARPVGSDDVAFLKTIAKDKGESVHLRMMARQTLSFIYYDKMQRDKSMRQKRRVLELAEGATAIDRRSPLFGLHPIKHEVNTYPAGDYIDFIANQERENLSNILATNKSIAEGRKASYPSPPQPVPASRPDGLLLSGGGTGFQSFRTSTDNTDALQPGGVYCDACRAGKPADDELKKCSCCGLAYYCSRACQKSHWPVHKPFCVKIGDFLSGDRALIKGLVNRSDLNGCVATLKELQDDRWLCSLPSSEFAKIKPANLSRLRPKTH
jgi:hypothetical protein